MFTALLSNIISFPGLGIGEFKLNPTAFEIPLPWTDGKSHPIMWYGIIITLAMIIAFCVCLRRAKYEGVKSDDMFDLAIYLIIFAMIGARLYYVIWNPEGIHSFYDVIAVWNGGLAIYGGIIAGAATILVYSKIKKIKTAKLLDIAAPGLILGQAIGRWGNFFNAEAHGGVTDLPWRMVSPQIAGRMFGENLIGADEYGEMLVGMIGVHPTFLYECLWNVIGFVLIMTFYKKKKYDGQVTLWYLVWYGFGRFFIEGLRTDSLYFLESVLGETIRVSQALAGLCFIGGVIALVVLGRRAKKKKLAEGEYEEIYTEKPDEDEDTPAFEVKEEKEGE